MGASPNLCGMVSVRLGSIDDDDDTADVRCRQLPLSAHRDSDRRTNDAFAGRRCIRTLHGEGAMETNAWPVLSWFTLLSSPCRVRVQVGFWRSAFPPEPKREHEQRTENPEV